MNGSTPFLSFQPEDLKFQIELEKQTNCDLTVSNNTDSHVAFKVKTTAPEKYCVRPNMGVIHPSDFCLIKVTQKAQREYPHDMISKDKFLIQSTIVSSNSDTDSLSADYFTKDSGRVIEKTKFRVLYDFPQIFKRITNEALDFSLPAAMNVSKPFLSVQPEDLNFQIELEKLIYCYLKVSNNTDSHVAFKVKTTAPKKYCVRPNRGVIHPSDSCLLEVTLQAQREYPPHMISKDKFLIQGTIVSPNSDTDSLSEDNFAKKSGREIDEIKLSVLHLSPIHPAQGDDDRSSKDLQRVEYEKPVSRHMIEKVRGRCNISFRRFLQQDRTRYAKMEKVDGSVQDMHDFFLSSSSTQTGHDKTE